MDELFATLAGGKTFSKLDLHPAYLQLSLETNSKQYTMINTHRDLLQYNRLPFGASSVPGRAIDGLVKGIFYVATYMDDILLTGGTHEQHLANLTADCWCLAGIHPTADKIKAIQEALQPHNVTELKSFLGLLSYYI